MHATNALSLSLLHHERPRRLSSSSSNTRSAVGVPSPDSSAPLCVQRVVCVCVGEWAEVKVG